MAVAVAMMVIVAVAVRSESRPHIIKSRCGQDVPEEGMARSGHSQRGPADKDGLSMRDDADGMCPALHCCWWCACKCIVSLADHPGVVEKNILET